MPNDVQPLQAILPRLHEAFCGLEDCFPRRLLVEFPRIIQQLEQLWGSREAMRYLQSLFLSDRSDRAGFDEGIIRELTLLMQVHSRLFPEESRDPNDAFYAAAVDPGTIDPDLLNAVSRGRGEVGLEHPGLPLPPGRSPVTAGQNVVPLRPLESAPAPGAAGTVDRPAPDAGACEPMLEKWPAVSSLEELRRLVSLKTTQVLDGFPREHRRLGDILLAKGCITRDALESALAEQRRCRGRRESLGKILVQRKLANESDVMRATCLQVGIPAVDLARFPISPETMRLIPARLAREKRAVPVAVIGNVLFLAVANPFSFPDRGYFNMATKREIELLYAPPNQLYHRLDAYGHKPSKKEIDAGFRNLAEKTLLNFSASNGHRVEEQPAQVVISENDATIVGLVNRMISDAIEMKASDIHVEAFPGNGGTRIRFRRDGRLEAYSEFPSAYHQAVVSRIKIIAGLDITERRRGQDGKIFFSAAGLKHGADLRVATVPTIRGIEHVIIRVLERSEPLRLDEIGLNEKNLASLRAVSRKPYGLILVCGPTGSGKTTTLHSILRELNTSDVKIWTVEDPVEIVQPNICQVQVNPKTGWSFATVLRSLLRADPDVVMIGEMRDRETASIALEASMTGHLVLSTLHTNSASETAARLLELGLDPFVLSDGLLAILAQRLARRLCRHCRTSRPFEETELRDLAQESLGDREAAPSADEIEGLVTAWRAEFGRTGAMGLWSAKGCDACSGTGFSGRVGLHELMTVSSSIRGLIRARASASELQRAATGGRMRTLRQDGIEKALLGLTTLNEVRSVCI